MNNLWNILWSYKDWKIKKVYFLLILYYLTQHSYHNNHIYKYNLGGCKSKSVIAIQFYNKVVLTHKGILLMYLGTIDTIKLFKYDWFNKNVLCVKRVSKD